MAYFAASWTEGSQFPYHQFAISPSGMTNWVYEGTLLGPQFTSSVTIGRDGTLYVVGQRGLYAFAGTNPPPHTGWPMHRQNARQTGKVERARFLGPSATTNGFECLIFGEVGWNYTVEASTNLTDWAPLTNFVAATNRTFVADPTLPAETQRFYRTFSPSH